MKYNKIIKLENGEYAVAKTNKVHFLPTYSTKLEASEQACIISAKWYQEQMDKCERKYTEILLSTAEDGTNEYEEIEYNASTMWQDNMA